MAKPLVRPRPRSDGSVGYNVIWREDGKQRSRTSDTEAGAKHIAKVVEATGTYTDADDRAVKDGELTVARLIDLYIADREKRVRSDRTTADYRRDADRWIIPRFGHLAAATVEDFMVQAWVDSIDRAPKTVANIHGVLSGAYKWGTRKRVDGRHLVTHNPCFSTELPARQKKVRGLRSGEWAILYTAAREVGDDAADVLLFLVGTGWRWSEMTALAVHQCQLDGPRPSVVVSGVHRRAADNTIRLVDDAKSAAGHDRTVHVSPAVADLLRRRITGKALGDFVFTGRDGKALRYSNFHHRVWGKPETGILARAKAAGLRPDPTLHWLRHTQAAMLLEDGASMAAIKARFGHASITTTVNTYGSLVDDVDDAALERLDAKLIPRPNIRAVGD